MNKNLLNIKLQKLNNNFIENNKILNIDNYVKSSLSENMIYSKQIQNSVLYRKNISNLYSDYFKKTNINFNLDINENDFGELNKMSSLVQNINNYINLDDNINYIGRDIGINNKICSDIKSNLNISSSYEQINFYSFIGKIKIDLDHYINNNNYSYTNEEIFVMKEKIRLIENHFHLLIYNNNKLKLIETKNFTHNNKFIDSKNQIKSIFLSKKDLNGNNIPQYITDPSVFYPDKCLKAKIVEIKQFVNYINENKISIDQLNYEKIEISISNVLLDISNILN